MCHIKNAFSLLFWLVLLQKRDVVGTSWDPLEYPVLPNCGGIAGNGSLGRICDPDNLLSVNEAEELDKLSKQIEWLTSDSHHCGYRIYIALADSISPNSTIFTAKQRQLATTSGINKDMLKTFVEYLKDEHWWFDYSCEKDLYVVITNTPTTMVSSVATSVAAQVLGTYCLDRLNQHAMEREGSLADMVKEIITQYKLAIMRQYAFCRTGMDEKSLIIILTSAVFLSSLLCCTGVITACACCRGRCSPERDANLEEKMRSGRIDESDTVVMVDDIPESAKLTLK